tara:strand:- start:8433 stop:9317 length:885 start_codon:yes stop_codon:yes gene_type:complete
MESNRTYLSHSQYALFKSSPKAYYEKYAEGKEHYGTKYQQFGKRLMENIEFGELDSIPSILRKRVKEGVVEKEITVRPKFFSKDLFGIIDVVGEGCKTFEEIKTGKIPWTMSKVMKDKQLLFYALMINLKYGVIPKSRLLWAETRDKEDGGIEFTGKVQIFHRQFTIEEITAFEKELLKVCVEIEEYEHTITSVSSDRDAKLLELLSEKKRIDEELDLIKAEIMLQMKELDNKYGSSENFNITIATRKSYTYSEELKEKIKSNNNAIKILKTEEENSGVAKEKLSEYLLIKNKN